MSLITLLVALLVLLIVGWLLITYVAPLFPAGIIRSLFIAIIVIIACLILLGFIGIGPGIKL